MVRNLSLVYLFFVINSIEVVIADTLELLVITDKEGPNHRDLSVQRITAEDIKNTNTGNKAISSLLLVNPNVKVKDDSKNSMTAGEITPGKISISGSLFYQNNMTIDGISNNSVIDPASSNRFNLYDVSGNENRFFIDVDLIEEINVYDSGISARHGNFLGGVIEVKTKRVKDDFSAKISYKKTNNSLTSFHIPNVKAKSFITAVSDSHQPIFKKSFYNFYVGTPINDSSGLLLHYSKKKSIISGGYFQGFKNKYRKNENIFIKHSYYFENDSILDTTLMYAPHESTHFSKYVKNSEVHKKSGGSSVKFNYENSLLGWDAVTSLGVKKSQNSRVSSNSYKEWIISQTKPWGALRESAENAYSAEGGIGTIDKDHFGLELNLDLESSFRRQFGIKYKLKTGLSLSFDQATYNRKHNFYYNTKPVFESNLNCNGDVVTCIQNEQYLSERRVFQKEKLTVGKRKLGTYFESNIHYKNLTIKPGIRLDYNDFMNNIDVAYRLNAKVDIADNLTFYGGLNRYYGRSFLGFKLRKARLPYYVESRGTRRNVLQDWTLSADQDLNKYQYKNLKTPFSNEIVFGVAYDVFNTKFNLKRVMRESKNQFTTRQDKFAVFTRPDGITKAYYKPKIITNEGKTSHQNTSLTINSVRPFNLRFADVSYSFSTSWQLQESNFFNYNSSVEGGKRSTIPLVYFNNEFVDLKDIQNNIIPQVYSLSLNLKFAPISFFGLSSEIRLNNMLTYNATFSSILPSPSGSTRIYREVFPDGSEEHHEVLLYEKVNFPSIFKYNINLSFDFALPRQNHLIVNIEVDNVFDEVQTVGNDRNNFRLGRQFWLNVQYRF